MVNPRQLLIGNQVHSILKEILNKIICLSDEAKQEGSSELLNYFSSMASLLGDDLVLNALSIAESGGVSYHFNGVLQELVDDEIKDNLNIHNLEKEIVSSKMEAEEHDEEFGDSLENSFLKIMESKPEVQNSPQGTSSQRKQSSDSTDIFSEIDIPFQMNAEVIPLDNKPIAAENNLCFYEVIFSPYTQNTCYIMPDVNFCCCEKFQKDVIEEENEYTCSHVVAVWLAKVLKTIRYVPAKPETLRVISRNLIDMVHEFR